jgi:error-prone DNA polymerase
VASITSFALYGFPESHAASFALIAYASAYLKAHYPAAFYTALLNNQPMGFYHSSTLVKDAQRRGVRFQPIDVQASDWLCTVEPDGAIRLGLRYVNGLRQEVGKAIVSARALSSSARRRAEPGGAVGPALRVGEDDTARCPKCGCDDPSMLEAVDRTRLFCNNCSHDWPVVLGGAKSAAPPGRFASLDDLIARTRLRRDEVVILADLGALNAFGYDRRSALWQAERAVRPAGELFDEAARPGEGPRSNDEEGPWTRPGEGPRSNDEEGPRSHDEAPCPLKPMTEAERVTADYAGMGLTVGRHPMALRRDELAMRGIVRASDLSTARQGRRIRVAGMVITRQRPGTAKGFVFLTLEDETGIVNIIVKPDLFARERLAIVEEPFLLVDGVLQNQDGVTSVRAEAVLGLHGPSLDFDAHDFY